MAKRLEFRHEKAILAEGIEDAAFLRELLQNRIRRPFDISPVGDLGDKLGNSGFASAMSSSEPITKFTDVKSVVLVSDNDEDPPASVALINKHINDAKANSALGRDWGIPVVSGKTTAGDPSLSLWMWPEPGVKGRFETVLWEIVVRKYPDKAKCVEKAFACAKVKDWTTSKLAKGKIRNFISLEYKKNPAISLSHIWRDAPEMFPVTDKAFKPILDFLMAV